MPRGPAERPLESRDPYLAVRAAIDRALMQGAAPVTAATPSAEPPRFGTAVQETAPVRRSEGVTRAREARSFLMVKRKGRKETPASIPAPDPHGRGARVDVRR